MNYQRLYDHLMKNARTRARPDGYVERHHVMPRSMGGSDSKDNIAVLTAREHYVAHWLLFKIYRNKAMAFAWFRLTHRRNHKAHYVSRSFAYARKARAAAVSRIFSGRELSAEHRKKLSDAKRGKTYTDLGRAPSPLRGRACSAEHRAKVSATSAGRKHSEETKRKCALAKLGEKNHRFGKKMPEHVRKILSDAVKGKARPDARRRGPSNTSGAVGVGWQASRRKWVASIHVLGRNIHLGRFDRKEDALAARKSAEARLLTADELEAMTKSYRQRKRQLERTRPGRLSAA